MVKWPFEYDHLGKKKEADQAMENVKQIEKKIKRICQNRRYNFQTECWIEGLVSYYYYGGN